MLRGTGATSSVIQAVGAPGGGVSARPNARISASPRCPALPVTSNRMPVTVARGGLRGRVAELDRRALAGVLVDAGLVVERDLAAGPAAGSAPAGDVGADGDGAVREHE